MMKMDGRDSTEFRNWEKMDKMVIREKFKSLKDNMYSDLSSPNEKEPKRGKEKGENQ